MTRYIEYHVIQSFAPSNLNRDDTGAPKDAMFGGHRRARISSQCLKRAIRLYMKEHSFVEPQFLAVRTRKLVPRLLEELGDLGEVEAQHRVTRALNALGLGVTRDGNTEYLLFLGDEEVRRLARAIREHWDELGKLAEREGQEASQDEDPASQKQRVRRARGEKGAGFTKLKEDLRSLLDGGKAVDIALFGRMLADRPELNMEAACQVAHAISVHRVEREFDYYTAVDDLAREEETGAGMIGEIEFNAATYYRYAVIDWETLIHNLQGDRELAQKAVVGFTKALVRALPTGKQNSFAAHNLPSFVGVALRDCPVNLANAFEAPIWPHSDEPISLLAVRALAKLENDLRKAYGFEQHEWAYLDLTGGWEAQGGPGDRRETLDELAYWVQEKLKA